MFFREGRMVKLRGGDSPVKTAMRYSIGWERLCTIARAVLVEYNLKP